MGANAQQDEPLGRFDTLLVMLRVAQCRQVNAAFCLNLGRCAMSYEERLAPPLDGHVLALGYVIEVDLNLGKCQHVSGGRQIGHEIAHDRFGAVGGRQTHAKC